MCDIGSLSGSKKSSHKNIGMLLQELESNENSAVGEEVRICFLQSNFLLLPFRSLVLGQTSTGQLCSSGSDVRCSFRWEILASALFYCYVLAKLMQYLPKGRPEG